MSLELLRAGLPAGNAAALLLELAVKGSILLLLGFLATRCWRETSAAIRHWLWVTVFAALLGLPLLATIAPAWRLPIPLLTHPLASTPVAGGDPPSRRAEVSTPPTPVVAVSIPTHQAPRGAGSLLLGAWAMGVSAVLLLLMGAHLRRALEVGRARTLRGGRAVSVLQRICYGMGITPLPRLVETVAGSMPTTSGVLRPVIAFPAGAVDSWPEGRLEGVLLHELAHVRRRDLLVQLFAQVACALHWYNPLAWTALRRLRLESEMACDDLVVASGVRASVYADLLLRLAREQRQPSVPALAWIPISERSQLPARVRAVLDASRRHESAPTGSIAWILLGAAALAGLVATAAGATGTAASSERPGQARGVSPAHVAEAPSMDRPGRAWSTGEPPTNAGFRPAGTATDTIPPLLLNRDAVEEAIRRSYPAQLRENGVSGTALVELEVDPAGVVARIRVLNASDPAFARAAPEALRAARFRPARTDDGSVGMVIHWPLAYNAFEGGQELAEALREREMRELLREVESAEGAREAEALRAALLEQQIELARLREMADTESRAGEAEALRAALLEQQTELARLREMADTEGRAGEAEALRGELLERQTELARLREMADTVGRAREAEALRGELLDRQAELARLREVEATNRTRGIAALRTELREQHAEMARLHELEGTERREEREAIRAMLGEQRAQVARLRAMEPGPGEAAAVERERQAAATALEMLEARLEADEEIVRSGTEAQPTGRVVGSVVNAAGDPVAEAVVTVAGADKGATTDRDGRFAIGGLPPGRYTLEVSVPGMVQDGSTVVSLTSGAIATIRVTVSPLQER